MLPCAICNRLLQQKILMMNFLNLLVVTLFAVVVSEKDYCDLCQYHSLCDTQVPGVACIDHESHPPTEEQKRLIVTIHNIFRQKVAMGVEKRGNPGPQPAAANMLKLEWDNELAKIAQREADQCVFEHDCAACRTLKRGDFNVGQNIVILSTTGTLTKVDFVRLISQWYEEEVGLMNKADVSKFKFGKWGHYSQMLWWNTRLVGCGASIFRKPTGQHSQIIFCNYGPAGNIPNAMMYKAVAAKDACSQCPEGTRCDSKFNKLCAIQQAGPVRSFHTDDDLPGLPSNAYVAAPKCEVRGFRKLMKQSSSPNYKIPVRKQQQNPFNKKKLSLKDIQDIRKKLLTGLRRPQKQPSNFKKIPQSKKPSSNSQSLLSLFFPNRQKKISTTLRLNRQNQRKNPFASTSNPRPFRPLKPLPKPETKCVRWKTVNKKKFCTRWQTTTWKFVKGSSN